MRGVVARRRVAFFGQSYDRTAGAPLPAFLLPLRSRIAHWAGIDSSAFAMALIERVPSRHAHRLASGRASVRRRRRDLALVTLSDEVPAVPFPFGVYVASSTLDTRDCAAAALGVPDEGRIATGVRTSHSAGRRVALLGDLPYAPLSGGNSRRDQGAPAGGEPGESVTVRNESLARRKISPPSGILQLLHVRQKAAAFTANRKPGGACSPQRAKVCSSGSRKMCC